MKFSQHKFEADLYGSLKHVAELGPVAEEVRPHPVHHAPVLQQVVLVVGDQHDDDAGDADVLLVMRMINAVSVTCKG